MANHPLLRVLRSVPPGSRRSVFSSPTSAALVAAACVVTLALGVRPVAAQSISGASTSTSGSTGNNGDTSGSTRASVAFTTNNSTTIATRFAWNVSADVGALSTRDQSGNAQHNISFDVTAPGGYRLDVSQSRVGIMQRNADVSNCDGAADTSGISGSQTGASVLSGSLSIGDPGSVGNGGGDASVPFSQSASANLVAVSNGVAHAHTLTFTWNGSVRSNSCEAAVRQGEGSSVSSCGACVYPGSPSRTQSSDGHFVSVGLVNLCGNGTIDTSVGEQCDQGGANGTSTSCCTSTCQFRASGQVCRPATAGGCDVAETCSGSSPTCPADGFAGSGTTCRAAAGECDLTETCPGGSPNCPADAKKSNGTSCTSDGNACTLDQCDGTNVTCQHPAGNAGATCHAVAGVCDVAETCTGASTSCPADAFVSSAVPCRASAGECDLTENCPGNGPNCPADAKVASGTGCTSDGNVCTLDQCDGVNDTCQHPAGNAGTTCHASAGVCDLAESCDGVGSACPADGSNRARPAAPPPVRATWPRPVTA